MGTRDSESESEDSMREGERGGILEGRRMAKRMTVRQIQKLFLFLLKKIKTKNKNKIIIFIYKNINNKII